MNGLLQLAALGDAITDPLGGRFTSIANIFGFAISALIYIGWALVFYQIALGFDAIIVSQGSPDNVKKGIMKVAYSIVGGLMLFSVMTFKAYIPQGIGTTGGIFVIPGITNFEGEESSVDDGGGGNPDDPPGVQCGDPGTFEKCDEAGGCPMGSYCDGDGTCIEYGNPIPLFCLT